MIFQTLQSAGLADVAFRSVVSGITRTSTDPAIQEGEPVILVSGSSADGQAVVRAVTASNAANNLWVGVAHEEIPHEGVGLAQVYGIDDIRHVAADVAAVGDVLVPNLNATNTQITGRSAVQVASPFYSTGAATNVSSAAINGLAGLAVAVAAATAAAATDGASTVKAHLRLL